MVIHGRYPNSEQLQGQQYHTLRPHTISNATIENKSRRPIDRNTFMPPDPHSLNHVAQNGYNQQQYSTNVGTSQEADKELQKVPATNTLRQVKSDQFQRVDDERRYSTIRRSCR